ncbi:MAG: hypothetical protein RR585_03135 [Coprobacillus sp.]
MGKESKENLERELFLLEMKDSWTQQDRDKVEELRKKIKELEN